MSERKFLKNLYHGCAGKALHFLYAFIIFLFVCILLNQKIWNGYLIHQYEGSYGHQETGWVFSQEDSVLDSGLSLPYFSKLQKGSCYSISTTLSYDASADSSPTAFFYVHHMFCRAYLDGEELFNYTDETINKLDKAKSPGNVYASVPLPNDCYGKEFRIEFIPPLSMDIDYELPNVLFGDYSTTIYYTFRDNLVHNIIILLTFFMGIASILISTFLLNGTEYREGIFIGLFAILFSAYNITECRFNFYLISNPYYTYLLNYSAFTLAPLTLIAFLRERFIDWRKKVCSYMLLIGNLIAPLAFALHFLGVKDLRELLPVFHVEYLVDLLLIFFMLSSMKRNKRKLGIVLQLVPILIGTLIDAVIYYQHLDISDSDAAFMTLGVIIFLIIELHHVWRSSNEIYTNSLLSREYHEMALIDSLTGIGNRRAYESERDSIISGEKSYSKLIVASLDVNDLKLVNDSIGHAAGDYLIRSAANILSDLVRGCGSIFRIGGDEFCALLYDIDELDFEARLHDVREHLTSLNSNSEVKLSLALGYEIISDRSIDDAFIIADKKMYINKNLKKELLRSKTNN